MTNKNILSLFMLSAFAAGNAHAMQQINPQDIEYLAKHVAIHAHIWDMKNKALSLKHRIIALEDLGLKHNPKTSAKIIAMKNEAEALENKLTSVENKRLKHIAIGTSLGVLLPVGLITAFDGIPKSYSECLSKDSLFKLGVVGVFALFGLSLADSHTVFKRARLTQDINRQLLRILNATEGKGMYLTPEQIKSTKIHF